MNVPRGTRRQPSLVVGAVGIAGLALAALVPSVTPAGATTTGLVPPANNLVVGSGSQLTYNVMNQVETLFNGSPGCSMISTGSNPQNLDYSCAPSGNPQFPPVTNGVTQYGYTENPINDVGIEEPPLGSNNGIKQLQDQGAHGHSATVAVANNVNFATNARDPLSSDLKGMTFVAYAEDGVSWFHFTEINGQPTPSANVTNLTQSQLANIFLKGQGSPITNWSQVGGSNAPIQVFSAQEGSATLTTWKTWLTAAGTDPSGPSGVAYPGNVINQNEDAAILARGPQVAADAIYYFPTGAYAASCRSSSQNCGGSPLPSGAANSLGSINGVAPSQATILANTFPVHRYLYNVYSNGLNPNIPESSAATLNLVSEDGFICKPQRDPNGKPILDPNTGVWYHTEIENAIINNGFIPLPNGAPASQNTTPTEEAAVTPAANSAYSLLSAVPAGASSAYGAPYLPWDKPTPGPHGNPLGYCLVRTTNSNSGT